MKLSLLCALILGAMPLVRGQERRPISVYTEKYADGSYMSCDHNRATGETQCRIFNAEGRLLGTLSLAESVTHYHRLVARRH